MSPGSVVRRPLFIAPPYASAYAASGAHYAGDVLRAASRLGANDATRALFTSRGATLAPHHPTQRSTAHPERPMPTRADAALHRAPLPTPPSSRATTNVISLTPALNKLPYLKTPQDDSPEPEACRRAPTANSATARRRHWEIECPFPLSSRHPRRRRASPSVAVGERRRRLDGNRVA